MVMPVLKAGVWEFNSFDAKKEVNDYMALSVDRNAGTFESFLTNGTRKLILCNLNSLMLKLMFFHLDFMLRINGTLHKT